MLKKNVYIAILCSNYMNNKSILQKQKNKSKLKKHMLKSKMELERIEGKSFMPVT